MAIKAHHRQPQQVKQKPKNEKSSSCHYRHHLSTPATIVPCFYYCCSLQASELREMEKKLGCGQVEELIEEAHED
nr:hypothetical protein CFP56_63330 [Quercus suber]